MKISPKLNSSNQIATISNVNFYNKNKRSKSLSVEGGPLKKHFKSGTFQEVPIYFTLSKDALQSDGPVSELDYPQMLYPH